LIVQILLMPPEPEDVQAEREARTELIKDLTRLREDISESEARWMKVYHDRFCSCLMTGPECKVDTGPRHVAQFDPEPEDVQAEREARTELIKDLTRLREDISESEGDT
jgi:hypothetical protein